MRHLHAACLGLSLLSLSAPSFSQNVNTSKESKPKYASETTAPYNMKGAYMMLSQKVKSDNEESLTNNNQLKIYTDRYFMYAYNSADDSAGGFGIGTYSVQNGKVIEYSLYSTYDGATPNSFKVTVNKREDGFSQALTMPGNEPSTSILLTEDYRAVGMNNSSPLDGAWKLSKHTLYRTDGTTVITVDRMQYKLFQAGYFMWGQTETDPATLKPRSAFGYGSFTIDGPHQVTEKVINSTFRSALVGNAVTLKLEFKGKDKYLQTITWPDGNKTVEEYNRMK